MDYAFGLRHVRQSDDAYLETGGGPVAAAEYDSTALFLNTRTYFGNGAAQPYLRGDLRYVAGGGTVPGAAADAGDGLIGFAGLGLRGRGEGMTYDIGLGGQFDDDGYAGASAQLLVRFTF
jgi:hypothetical protein